MKPLTIQDPLVTRQALASEFAVSLTTLWRWEKNGVIPKSIKIGGRVGWPRSVANESKVKLGWPAQEAAKAAVEGGAQ